MIGSLQGTVQDLALDSALLLTAAGSGTVCDSRAGWQRAGLLEKKSAASPSW